MLFFVCLKMTLKFKTLTLTKAKFGKADYKREIYEINLITIKSLYNLIEKKQIQTNRLLKAFISRLRKNFNVALC